MYKLTQQGVQNLDTKGFIVDNIKNPDWRKYLKWLEEGNTPEPIETDEENEMANKNEKRKIEQSIVEMRMKKDAATAEGLDEYAMECETELTRLRQELIDFKPRPKPEKIPTLPVLDNEPK